MKYVLRAILIILITATNIYAQDFLQWQLPYGAKMRLGNGNLYDIDYSPDGTKIAAATSIGIWIYDAQTGEARKLISDAHSGIRKVAYSLDGKTILSDINDRSLCLWDVNSGKQIRTYWGHSHPQITALAFSPDGKTFASGGIGGSVRVWDIESGRQLHRLSAGSSVTSIAYSPDGKILAASSAHNQNPWIFLYEADTGDLILWLRGHTGGVSSLAFSLDGKTLASGSYDNTVRLWDVDAILARGVESTDILRHVITEHTDAVYDLTYSPDGRYLVTASQDKTIRLFSASNLNARYTFTGDTYFPQEIALSPDGSTLVSRNSDRTIRLLYDYNGIDGSYGWGKRTIATHTFLGPDIAISPDGNTLVTDGLNNTLSLWDVNTGTQQGNLAGHTSYIKSVAFSPVDNNLVASGSNDGTMRLWHADTGTERNTLISVDGEVESVVFSPDGSKVACAITYGEYSPQYYLRDSNIHLFDVETGTALLTIAAHIAPPSPNERLAVHPTRHVYPVNAITFTPHGEALVSISFDDTIRFWNTQTGAHSRVIAEKTCPEGSMAFSPDGKILACADWYDNINMRDVQTNRLLHTLTGHTDRVNQIVFSPDGTTLASCSRDGTVRIWDVNMGVLLSTFTGHKGAVYSVVFSPDGSTLVSGGGGGTILLWDTTVRIPSNTAVDLSPTTIQSPVVGEQLTLSLNITAGQNVMGYQATVNYDPTALRYVESTNGDYLVQGISNPDIVGGVSNPDSSAITLYATTYGEQSNGDGTLATITFEVITIKPSTVSLFDVLLTDNVGNSTKPTINGSTAITAPVLMREDVNADGIVNILDLSFIASNFGKTGKNPADVNGDGVVNIVDLALVAAAIGNNGDNGEEGVSAAPTLLSGLPSREDVQSWLHEARQLNLSDPDFQRGIQFLENLLKSLTPKQTALLPNYPNPFNPETWIPYQLASPADVRIDIYASDGQLVRQLDIGQQTVGIHQQHWDGNNDQGEKVASGVYFYTLRAGDWTATRKMSILK